MFHSYVTASAGHRVDIGRAQFLMDKEVWADTAAWMDVNGDPSVDSSVRDQAFFNQYCVLHQAKYGRSFEPDVNPRWD